MPIDASPTDAAPSQLKQRDFAVLAALIEKHAGIRMPGNKSTMLEGRLRRRLRERGLTDFSQYCDFLFKQGGLAEELTDLIDVVTTNKTEFFRESKHFDHLSGPILSACLDSGIGLDRPLRLWSAGCSTGQEPYTIAMVLAEAAAQRPGFSFQILATDISTSVLRTARKAIYPESMVAPVPPDLRKRYLMRSRDRRAELVRVVPELRATVSFRQLNFIDTDYGITPRLDIVFCRNVIIYFDQAVRKAVLGRICQCLAPGGYLLMGHSETLGELGLPLRQVAPTVYRRC
ncbi:MAG: chemotaxis protein CheR [Azospirillum sp.]|nr:chemotaxis protein CheR [Azospirillum sp.]